MFDLENQKKNIIWDNKNNSFSLLILFVFMFM